jgi:hypothetical protein
MERGPGNSRGLVEMNQCIAIHKCLEAMLGISLYSYMYLKLAKTMSFLLSHILSLQQN